MTGFGEALRRERETHGLSLETLSAATKVSVAQLEALEQEQFARLPKGVFRRGMVRAYLAQVGLGEADWMARFDTSQAAQGVGEGEQDWEQFAENVSRSRAVAVPRRSARWLGVAALLLLVLGGAFAVWRLVVRPRLRAAGNAGLGYEAAPAAVAILQARTSPQL